VAQKNRPEVTSWASLFSRVMGSVNPPFSLLIPVRSRVGWRNRTLRSAAFIFFEVQPVVSCLVSLPFLLSYGPSKLSPCDYREPSQLYGLFPLLTDPHLFFFPLFVAPPRPASLRPSPLSLLTYQKLLIPTRESWPMASVRYGRLLFSPGAADFFPPRLQAHPQELSPLLWSSSDIPGRCLANVG